MTDPVRDAVARVVCDALRMEGWVVPPSAGFAVANALRARPGLVRQFVGDDPEDVAADANIGAGG